MTAGRKDAGVAASPAGLRMVDLAKGRPNSISCRSIVRSFGDPPNVILKELSFEITAGEFVAITGRSGSGKSTLLYTVSGLDDINSGLVLLGGQDLREMNSVDLHKFRNEKMGFVFQFHYLLPEISALDNVLMPARKFKMDRVKLAFAEELMHEFEIDHCKGKYPSQMSGGELQRVAIARALIMEPDFLFADEPTGNLDSINGGKVMDILEKINIEKKTTILLVTHEPDYAERASRQIQLVDGRISSDKLQKHRGKAEKSKPRSH